MNAEYAGYAEDLRRILREMGYSVKAVKEVLKWYVADDFDG